MGGDNRTARGGDGTVTLEVATAFAAGALVAGRYRVARRIGAGAAGEVYECEDLVLGGTVALKTVRADRPLASGDAVERLRREIALARKITHPNVCRMHDAGEHDGRVFLTMELVRGETLAARIARGPLAIDQLLAIAQQLAAALAAAHAAGVVHRDLKSSNVMLADDRESWDGPRPRVVVCDFGLARSSAALDDRITAEAALVGTPAYMAPEQVAGHTATAASDIYAFGVVLYEMATGDVPFRGDTPIATATARLHREPRPPSALRPELPAWLDAAILRCLARSQGARPPRAADVLGRGRVRARRWPLALAGALGAAALALVIALVGARGSEAAAPPSRHWAAGIRPEGRIGTLFDRAHRAILADDWTDARDALEQAVSIDPADPIAQAALAEVLAELGYAERALDSAQRTTEHGDSLAAAERHFVATRIAIARGDAKDAVERLRAAVTAEPGERSYRFALVRELARTDDSAAVAHELAELAGPSGDAEAIDLELARAAIATPPLAVVHAALAEARAGATARQGDRARALVAVGAARQALGDAAGAAEAFTAALQGALATGRGRTALRARRGLRDLAGAAGRIDDVRAYAADEVAQLRTLGGRERLAASLEELARLAISTGRLAQAAAAIAEQRDLAAALHDDVALGWANATEAYLALARGRLAEAADLAERTYWTGRTLKVQGLQGNAFHSWSEALLELGDDAGYARALGARGPSVERLADAYAAFRLGDLARAERIAGPLAGWKTREGRDAYIVVARCLVRRGELAEAARIVERVARPLGADDGALQQARRVILARAELLAARGDRTAALALLDAHAAACGAAGLGFCEVTSAALAVELAGDEAARRAALLLPRARALGFGRIVRELESKR